jgi:hypothetical protein
MNKVLFKLKTKHSYFLIGKFCKDNNISIYPETWDRISKWENNFDSTEDEEYKYLHFYLRENILVGCKSERRGDDCLENVEESILYLNKIKDLIFPNFNGWEVRKEGDQFIFGCGEVTLTADEIKSFGKIYQILIDKDLIKENSEISNFIKIINSKS